MNATKFGYRWWFLGEMMRKFLPQIRYKWNLNEGMGQYSAQKHRQTMSHTETVENSEGRTGKKMNSVCLPQHGQEIIGINCSI